MPIPIDHQAREQALDIHQSFIVSAPAGSGKTGLLTQRILALLAHCDEPENIIAITFTRKAAAEMQSRIMEALHFAQNTPTEPAEDYQKTTWTLARAVLEQDKAQNWQLFNCPNRLRITTIDSLCRSISQQMPFSSLLGATPEILDNPNIAYKMAVQATLELLHKPNDLQNDLIQLAKHLDNRLDTVERLLIQLLAKRDQWLALAFQTQGKRQQLEAMLQELISSQLQEATRLLSPVAGEISALADYAASHLQSSDSPIRHCLGLPYLPDPHVNSLYQWRGITELLLTKSGQPRGRLSQDIGFLPNNSKDLNNEEKAQLKLNKERMMTVLQWCKDSPEVAEALSTLQLLPDTTYNDGQWQILESLMRILRHLAGSLSLAFQQLGKSDYLSITLAALQALGEPEEPTDLALALDYKIQHILVDEFQDTSSTQLELLQRLSNGWQPDDGRTLFFVGDAMQSCYRFRDANVGIFLDVRERGLGNIDVIPLTLSVNFRSQQGIVDWVNNSFAPLFPATSNSYTGAVSYAASTAFNPELPLTPVSSHLTACEGDSKPPEENAAETIVRIIQQSQQAHPNDSIAVLVRSKSHAQPVIRALKTAGIDYQATDIDQLSRSMPVSDLFCLTRILLYPHDHLAWLAVLRAPWCGLDMDDLLTLCEKNSEGKTPLLATAITNQALIERLSTEGQYRLQRFASAYNKVHQQQYRLPLRQHLYGLWLALGGPALLLDQKDQEDIQQYLKLLDHYEQGGTIKQWEQLEQAVNDLYASPKNDTSNPVQIMSIHKSKGLEFDTVIIPSLEKSPRPADKELFLWNEHSSYNPQTHQQQRQLLMSPISPTGSDESSLYRFIHLQHRKKNELETDRLLYVACTRAIKQLHLCGSLTLPTNETSTDANQQSLELIEQLKTPTKNSLLNRLWPVITSSETTEATLIAEQNNWQSNPHIKHPNHIVCLDQHWQTPAIPKNTLLKHIQYKKPVTTEENNPTDERENLASPDALLQREQRYIGTIVHLALQHITETGYQQWTPQRLKQQEKIWQAQLLELGLSKTSMPDALTTIRTAINNTLNHEKGKWLLDNTFEASATELSLYNQYGQHIIDRTFIENDYTGKKTRWIIDYKTTLKEEQVSEEEFVEQQKQQYAKQLERYQCLFSHENTHIRTAFYFPLMKTFTEV